MKKIFISLIFILQSSLLLAGNEGKGELQLNERALNHFIQYIKGKTGFPEIHIISEDSSWFKYYYCPDAGGCGGAGEERKEIRLCEKAINPPGQFDKKCGLFAKKKKVVWRNGINKSDRNSYFKSTWDREQFIAKLKELGFYGANTSGSSNRSQNSSVTYINIQTGKTFKSEGYSRNINNVSVDIFNDAMKKCEKGPDGSRDNCYLFSVTKPNGKTKKYDVNTNVKPIIEDDITQKLSDLNKLFKSGVITKDEFEAAKKRLLK